MSFSPSAAVNFFSKIMFKKKLDFSPLNWAVVESGAEKYGGDIYVSTQLWSNVGQKKLVEIYMYFHQFLSTHFRLREIKRGSLEQ